MRFLCIIPHYHAKNSANNICMMSIVEKNLGGGAFCRYPLYRQ